MNAEADILRARARAIAGPLPSPGDAAPDADAIEVLAFHLATERYAVETRFVQAVHPLPELTPLPCVPRFVAGIANLRSQVVTVLDLRRFLDLPDEAPNGSHRVLLLDDGCVGVLADGGVAVLRIRRGDLQTQLATRSGIAADMVRGVTREGTVVLDIERVLADPRLVVDAPAPGSGAKG